jgi:hypothetical protein
MPENCPLQSVHYCDKRLVLLRCLKVAVHQTPFLCLLETECSLSEARLVENVLLQKPRERLILEESREESRDGVEMVEVLPSFPKLCRRFKILQSLQKVLVIR